MQLELQCDTLAAPPEAQDGARKLLLGTLGALATPDCAHGVSGGAPKVQNLTLLRTERSRSLGVIDALRQACGGGAAGGADDAELQLRQATPS